MNTPNPTNTLGSMNVYALLRYVLRRGGGTFRVSPDGRTFAPLTETSGYIVALRPGTWRQEWSGYMHAADLLRADARAMLSVHPSALFGVEYLPDATTPDGRRGILNVDPVALVATREEAERIGRENGQRAYFDLAAGRTVNL